MSMKLLGEHFDIHGGGLDLVFPHHENEVVQSESFSGKPFATFWLHNGLLTKGGKKISKSDPETIVLMGDLLEQHDPDTVRALLLSSHYRRPIDYGPSRLDEIARGLQAFRNFFERSARLTGESFYELQAPRREAEARTPGSIVEIEEHRGRFLEAMDDDFNTGGALGELFEMLRGLNRFADAKKLEGDRDPAVLAEFRAGVLVLRELTQILGLFRAAPAPSKSHDDGLTPALLDLLVKLRTQVRKEKNFALADQIRKELAALGVILEDRPDGTAWKIEPRET